MMSDDTIIQYRKKHKKCKWCKYYKYNSLEYCHYVTCYGECILKDKIINYENMPRICKYYELKEQKCQKK